MKTDNVIKTMKEIHPETIILIQIGAFYHVYGKDAYILSYLFGYQIKTLENSYNTCGVPKSGLNKVLKILEDNKINYLVVIKSQNYSVETDMKYKSSNRYREIYEKAYKYVSIKNRINAVHNYLMENIDSPNIKSLIQKLEEDLFDC